jgi:peptidoglycan/xylan/chitin deacetylase (PgdA/CDA1 family)
VFYDWNPHLARQFGKTHAVDGSEKQRGIWIGAHRRRMMVVSFHDRISGHAGRVRVLDRFLTYAKSKPDVWFARKDEIARYALLNRAATLVINRGSPAKTGLPGPIVT